MSDEISPDKEAQPSECCFADTKLDMKVDRSGKYIVKETCSECGGLLRTDDNL